MGKSKYAKGTYIVYRKKDTRKPITRKDIVFEGSGKEAKSFMESPKNKNLFKDYNSYGMWYKDDVRIKK